MTLCHGAPWTLARTSPAALYIAFEYWKRVRIRATGRAEDVHPVVLDGDEGQAGDVLPLLLPLQDRVYPRQAVRPDVAAPGRRAEADSGGQHGGESGERSRQGSRVRERERPRPADGSPARQKIL